MTEYILYCIIQRYPSEANCLFYLIGALGYGILSLSLAHLKDRRGIATPRLVERSGCCYIMLDEYLKWKATYTRPNTAKAYAPYIHIFCGLVVDNCPKVSDIIVYHDILSKKYSEKTIAFGMAVLKDFVGFYSEKEGWGIKSDDVRIPRARSHSHLPITEVEYITILTHIHPVTMKALRDVVLIRMLYDTGCRISELVNCQSFDTVKRMAKIENAKRDDEGFIFWGRDTNTFLETYLDQHPKPIFPSARHCQRIIQGYCKLAGIEKHISCHSFRHGKAWRVLDQFNISRSRRLSRALHFAFWLVVIKHDHSSIISSKKPACIRDNTICRTAIPTKNSYPNSCVTSVETSQVFQKNCLT